MSEEELDLCFPEIEDEFRDFYQSDNVLEAKFFAQMNICQRHSIVEDIYNRFNRSANIQRTESLMN